MDFQKEGPAAGRGGEVGMVIGEMLEPPLQQSSAAGWRMAAAAEEFGGESRRSQGEGTAGVGQAGQGQRGAINQDQPGRPGGPEPAVPGPGGLIEGRPHPGFSPPGAQPLGGQERAESSQSEPIRAGRHGSDSIRPGAGHEELVFPA